MGHDWQLKDITGQKFGRLTVIKRVGRNKQRQATWLCQCECGNQITVVGCYLRGKRVMSCGCLRKDNLLKSITKHNKSRDKIYKVFTGMKARCYNKNSIEYKNYGARGIKICEEWLNNFLNFYDWAIANGYDENAEHGKCTIDRIDVNGDYCPNNCRFVSNLIQQRNKRNNRFIEYKGIKLCVSDWEKRLNFSQGTIKTRIKNGWSIKQIIETPIHGDKKMIEPPNV